MWSFKERQLTYLMFRVPHASFITVHTLPIVLSHFLLLEAARKGQKPVTRVTGVGVGVGEGAGGRLPQPRMHFFTVIACLRRVNLANGGSCAGLLLARL